MSIPAAYATVVAIWSTTPLAIAWSNDGFTPVMAVFSRMLIAALVGLAIIRLLGIELPWHRRALLSYLAAVVGVFGGMLLTYMAAQYVPSGLISVLFGTAPIITGVLAQYLLGEQRLSLIQWMASFMALAGLGVIFLDDLAVSGDGAWGLLLLLGGVFTYSLSSVLVKRSEARLHPFAQTVGALVMSLPLFALSWWAMDGQLPELDWQRRAPWAILYLALAGSLLGFACYFYVLQRVPAKSVNLVTLVTPVFALLLGAKLNGEQLSLSLVFGAIVIGVALVLYLWGDLWRERLFPRASTAPTEADAEVGTEGEAKTT